MSFTDSVKEKKRTLVPVFTWKLCVSIRLSEKLTFLYLGKTWYHKTEEAVKKGNWLWCCCRQYVITVNSMQMLLYTTCWCCGGALSVDVMCVSWWEIVCKVLCLHWIHCVCLCSMLRVQKWIWFVFLFVCLFFFFVQKYITWMYATQCCVLTFLKSVLCILVNMNRLTCFFFLSIFQMGFIFHDIQHLPLPQFYSLLVQAKGNCLPLWTFLLYKVLQLTTTEVNVYGCLIIAKHRVAVYLCVLSADCSQMCVVLAHFLQHLNIYGWYDGWCGTGCVDRNRDITLAINLRKASVHCQQHTLRGQCMATNLSSKHGNCFEGIRESNAWTFMVW